MAAVASVVYYLLLVFLLLLIFRLVMDYVFVFARSFRPSGALAIALELAYSATDPPLKALRRLIPPLRVGNVSIDLGFIIVFFLVSSVLMPLAKSFIH